MKPAGTRRLLFRLRIVFLVLFALGAAGTWSYEVLWGRPARECAAAQKWWDPASRVCALPVSVSTFTGRPIEPKTPPSP
jgi:hypothetical protein